MRCSITTARAEAPAVEIPSVDTGKLSTTVSVVNRPALPDPMADSAAGVVLKNQSDTAQETNIQLLNTGKDDASIEGNGDGNGQVPPGQTEEEDGTIVNPGGNTPPGLNRGEKGEKPDNSNKPVKPDNPGTEDSTDKKANKANKGTHKYDYDSLNRMTSSNIAGTTTTYTYDTLGNLVLEKTKNKVVDYQYNELNQLTKKKEGNESYNYTYDKRGNRTAETGKKASRSYLYDETNRMVEGTNWKGDKSAYTYNGLGLRVNNTHTTHAGKVYARDYVIDYTSFENDDLMVFAEGNGQLEYEQKHVYAGSERIEQFTDKGNWERTLYVHEDVMGNTRYYTKANGQSFAELTYDAWGMPESPNKLLNNDHGNYVFATFTGHIYDTTLDIYFAEARFYDANNRTWLAIDPVKDGGNWYQYCYSNPTTFYDPTGLAGFSPFSGCVDGRESVEFVVVKVKQGCYNFGAGWNAGQLEIEYMVDPIFRYFDPNIYYPVTGRIFSRPVSAEDIELAITQLYNETNTGAISYSLGKGVSQAFYYLNLASAVYGVYSMGAGENSAVSSQNMMIIGANGEGYIVEGSAGTPIYLIPGTTITFFEKGDKGKTEENSNSEVDEIVDNIPNKYKQNGQCDCFAERLVEQLEKSGVDYDIIRIDSKYSIYSDKAGDAVGNGYHYGVKVGDTIYDNMTSDGMSFDAWLDDLGLNSQPKEIIDWSVVDEILPY